MSGAYPVAEPVNATGQGRPFDMLRDRPPSLIPVLTRNLLTITKVAATDRYLHGSCCDLHIMTCHLHVLARKLTKLGTDCNDSKQSRLTSMNVNESAAASTKVVGAAAIISRALYRVLTKIGNVPDINNQ